MKKLNDSGYTSAWIKKASVYMYVLLMAGIYPVCFLDSSIALVSAKIMSYQYINTILLIMLFLGGIAWISEWARGDYPRVEKAISKVDIFAVILAVAMVISTFVSQNMQEAFLGTKGKKFGALVLLICVFNYFAISRYFKLKKAVIWMHLLGSSLTFLLQIVNHWGFNPLELWTPSNQFAAAIGNINLNAAYDVFALSIGMGLYIVAREKQAQYIYMVYLLFGFCGLFCCRSDLGIAGIGTAFLVMMWFTMRDEEMCFKCIWLIIIFGASAGIIALGRMFFRKNMFPFDSTIAILTYPVVPVLIITGGFCIMALYKWQMKTSTNFKLFLKWIHGIVFSLIAAAAVTGIALFILVNTVYQNAVIPEVFSLLRFTDEFASNRGYIWKRCIEEYAASPLKHKLAGYGANCFSDLVNPKYYGEMAERGLGIFVDAHNELLQMLATIGIIGIVGYFGMFLSILFGAVRKVRTNIMAIIPAIVIFALLAQGMFYSPHVTVTPMFFIFLGIVESERRKNNL